MNEHDLVSNHFESYKIEEYIEEYFFLILILLPWGRKRNGKHFLSRISSFLEVGYNPLEGALGAGQLSSKSASSRTVGLFITLHY